MNTKKNETAQRAEEGKGARKLRLDKQTIRTLTGRELQEVAGAAISTQCTGGSETAGGKGTRKG